LSWDEHLTERKIQMKKLLIAGAVTIICSSAFAQTATGPAPQGDNMNKPGVAKGSGASNRGQMHGTTTGKAGRDPNGGNPNGTAGGPTSLSGTGSSQYGGNGTAGTTNGR
jgi:hypothetical protein